MRSTHLIDAVVRQTTVLIAGVLERGGRVSKDDFETTGGTRCRQGRHRCAWWRTWGKA